MLNKERPPAVNLEEGPVYGTELGDLGIVVVAAGISIVGLLMIVLPSPIPKIAHDTAVAARIEAQAQAKQAKIARQKEIDQAVASGVVGVDILPSKSH
jgi:hypothetical protein